jgi:hypothetical protein
VEQERARRILGLSKRFDPRQLTAAHARLRAHVAGRADTGGSRLAELETLDEVRDSLRHAMQRRRRWAGIAAVALLVGALALGRLAGPWEAAPAAALAVSERSASEPEGLPSRLELEVGPAGASAALAREGSVEDAARVEAGVSNLELEPGTYAVRAWHPDCASDAVARLVLKAGESQRLALRACPHTGWLVVRSAAAGDALAIDGTRVGTTGPTVRPLPSGEHRLRVERAGHVAWQGGVEIPAGETVSLRADLAAQPAPEARPAARSPLPAIASALRGDESNDDAQPLPSNRWTQQVREFLLRYDADRSGMLDTEPELAAVPCDEWLGIAGSHDRSRFALSFARFYGFDAVGSSWKGASLGIDAGLREVTRLRLRECGLR